MDTTRSDASRADLRALEAAVALARADFACIFSSSDEYESALITERRAQGRYRTPSIWPVAFFFGCALAMAGTVLFVS